MYFRMVSFATFGIALLADPSVAQMFDRTWIHQIGTSGRDWPRTITPDRTGGVYVGGQAWGELGGALSGANDAWLARYDGDGDRTWIRQFGSNLSDSCTASVVDGEGGVFIGGNTNGAFAAPNTGSTDAWVARYSGTGNQMWAHQFGNPDHGGDTVMVIVADQGGGAHVVGSGGIANYVDYIAHYDGNGIQTWIRPFERRFSVVASDENGGFYIGGSTYDNLGGPNAGETDAWFARIDGDGNEMWIRQFGTSVEDYVGAIAFDGVGGAYLAGGTQGSLGGPNAGDYDAWVAHYDGDGNRLWLSQFGTDRRDTGGRVAWDGVGGMFVAGAVAHSDLYVAHYNAAGDQTWIDQFGTPTTDYVMGLAPGRAGGVFIAGETYGSLGGSNAGNSDIWIARYVPTCLADFNIDGAVDTLDFLEFLNAFSTRSIRADFNEDGSVDTLDFLSFLVAFDQGCQ